MLQSIPHTAVKFTAKCSKMQVCPEEERVPPNQPEIYCENFIIFSQITDLCLILMNKKVG